MLEILLDDRLTLTGMLTKEQSEDGAC